MTTYIKHFHYQCSNCCCTTSMWDETEELNDGKDEVIERYIGGACSDCGCADYDNEPDLDDYDDDD